MASITEHATPVTEAFKNEYYNDCPHLEPVFTSKDMPRLPRRSYLGVSRTKDKSTTLQYALEIMVHKVGHLLELKMLLAAEESGVLDTDSTEWLNRLKKKEWFCSLKDEATSETFEQFRNAHYSCGHIVDMNTPGLTLEQIRAGVVALKDFFKPEELHANEIETFDRALALIDKHIALGQQVDANVESAKVSGAGITHEGKLKPLSPMSERVVF